MSKIKIQLEKKQLPTYPKGIRWKVLERDSWLRSRPLSFRISTYFYHDATNIWEALQQSDFIKIKRSIMPLVCIC